MKRISLSVIIACLVFLANGSCVFAYQVVNSIIDGTVITLDNANSDTISELAALNPIGISVNTREIGSTPFISSVQFFSRIGSIDFNILSNNNQGDFDDGPWDPPYEQTGMRSVEFAFSKAVAAFGIEVQGWTGRESIDHSIEAFDQDDNSLFKINFSESCLTRDDSGHNGFIGIKREDGDLPIAKLVLHADHTETLDHLALYDLTYAPTVPCDCPDSDGDGVPDAWDECPNTPQGSTVYSNGCPGSGCQGDFDGDGDVDSTDLSVFAENYGWTDCCGDNL